MVKIRNEKETDYRLVEEITRNAFYNLYVPGCTEHYLVHVMRSHEDFIPELDLVIEIDGKIIGNIMYTKARLVDENGTEKTFLLLGLSASLLNIREWGMGKVLWNIHLKRQRRWGMIQSSYLEAL